MIAFPSPTASRAGRSLKAGTTPIRSVSFYRRLSALKAIDGVPADRTFGTLQGRVTSDEYYGGDDELRRRVTIVRTAAEAAVALQALYGASGVHCCDTEVADIDLKKVGPVGHGRVTCLSIFSGPTVDYGDGPGKALWIDNLDEVGPLPVKGRRP